MRVAAILWCAAIPGLQVYIFRRIFADLIKNHMEGPKGFRALLAPWVDAGLVAIVEEEIRFWNGSKIFLCHCQYEKDRYKYQGAEIHVLMIDELTTFTDVIYRFLRSRVRCVGLKIPEHYYWVDEHGVRQCMFPRILCGSNPGNIGHHAVKEAFIDPRIEMIVERMTEEEGGMLRQFIPAKLDDNPSMLEDDPGYEYRLSGLGSPELVKAMRDGNWDVIAGAYFTEFGNKHKIKPFAVPPWWTRLRALDWGSSKPFAVGWFCISDGTPLEDGRLYPAGSLIMYREYYGASKANVGLKMTPHAVAREIVRRDNGEIFAYSVADPSCFDSEDGPCPAEDMRALGVSFRRADNKRVAGWNQMRWRLEGYDGKPMIYFFETCRDTIRTVPALPHDEIKNEDVDTASEDHAGDMVRYACMSRPFIRPEPVQKKPRALKDLTLDELWQRHEQPTGVVRY